MNSKFYFIQIQKMRLSYQKKKDPSRKMRMSRKSYRAITILCFLISFPFVNITHYFSYLPRRDYHKCYQMNYWSCCCRCLNSLLIEILGLDIIQWVLIVLLIIFISIQYLQINSLSKQAKQLSQQRKFQKNYFLNHHSNIYHQKKLICIQLEYKSVR